MKGIKFVINKELARVFKDRKMIFSLFILPVVIMVAIYGIMGAMITNVNNDIAAHIADVYVVDAPEGFAEAAGSSGFTAVSDIHWLESKDAETADTVEAVKNDILEEHADILIVFDKDYMQKIEAYANDGNNLPSVECFFNSTADYSRTAYNSFNSMALKAYEDSLLGKRLGSLDALKVSDVQVTRIEKESKASGQFLGMMLPYLIVMLLFAGAMSVGVDAIAGEKERGTLASMLLTPVSRTTIAAGKIISLSILSGLSAVVYAAAMIVTMPTIGGPIFGDVTGGSVSFGIVQGLQLFAIMVCLVYLFVAVIALLAVLSKSVKEASSYISPIYIVVIIAGMMTMFTSGSDKAVYEYAIPIYGNALAIKDIIFNELTGINFLASIAGIVVIAIILTVAVAKAFNSEKVMFNA